MVLKIPLYGAMNGTFSLGFHQHVLSMLVENIQTIILIGAHVCAGIDFGCSPLIFILFAATYTNLDVFLFK